MHNVYIQPLVKRSCLVHNGYIQPLVKRSCPVHNDYIQPLRDRSGRVHERKTIDVIHKKWKWNGRVHNESLVLSSTATMFFIGKCLNLNFPKPMRYRCAHVPPWEIPLFTNLWYHTGVLFKSMRMNTSVLYFTSRNGVHDILYGEWYLNTLTHPALESLFSFLLVSFFSLHYDPFPSIMTRFPPLSPFSLHYHPFQLLWKFSFRSPSEKSPPPCI